MNKITKEVTQEEAELIDTLRNYRRGFPNTKFLSREINALIRLLKRPDYDY